MTRNIARAIAYPLQHRGETALNAMRFLIVGGSALAVILAGPALPF